MGAVEQPLMIVVIYSKHADAREMGVRGNMGKGGQDAGRAARSCCPPETCNPPRNKQKNRLTQPHTNGNQAPLP
jgi:hypothetical protein